ncbi:hypothetical protein PGT21_013754 [Puccinia graminis f. sp. tritici]|uniref:Uncharacterized protein n=2 Tax=Puccinia graminis f. sp. tritici TaxID=56615 RepID=E3KKJ1_PUCGT|nr:uncharacterized protein PGTG_10287 [Puccinia graminis f. sp. tritici CRL 75-36-700-3]EFP84816.2 hypothetical protein PGTG_10287 [Puccinia graminis f. sp. tritici CRL 75-36-700-3]KAA1073880.1 hypothetical protein PGTUg99_016225 [Puccinia graminis f. sp. tritici]KAA1116434.1 hypothetical protein PGT21_013754 [Puccinia graminis f. sp. tritici]
MLAPPRDREPAPSSAGSSSSLCGWRYVICSEGPPGALKFSGAMDRYEVVKASDQGDRSPKMGS